MNIFSALTLVSSLFILSGCGGVSATSNNFSCEPPVEIKQNMLRLINQARAQGRECGDQFYNAAPPLTWNSKLELAAKTHSNDMASKDFFNHTGSDNTSPNRRVQNTGYNWIYQGENLAAGIGSSTEAMEKLLKSPGHCQNIMNPVYKELGAACKKNINSTFILYWTQEFGTQR